MLKFKCGDRIIAKINGIDYKGVIVETNSGCYKTDYLCKLKNFIGHSGNGSTNRGRDYDTKDYWYLEEDHLNLLEPEKVENKPEKVEDKNDNYKGNISMNKICKFSDIRIGSKIVTVPKEKDAPLRVECKTIVATIDGEDYEAVCMPGDEFTIEDGIKAILTKAIFGSQTKYDKLIRNLVKFYELCEKKRDEEKLIEKKKAKNAARKKARAERKANTERTNRVNEMSEAFLDAMHKYSSEKAYDAKNSVDVGNIFNSDAVKMCFDYFSNNIIDNDNK